MNTRPASSPAPAVVGREELAAQLEQALVERDEQRFRTIAFVNRHEIIAALSNPPAPEAEVEAMRRALERIADPRNIHFAGDAQALAAMTLAAVRGGVA